MKKRTILILFLVGICLITSACSGINPGSWPGLSVTTDTAYVSYNSFVYAVKLSDGSLSWKYPTAAQSSTTFFAAPVLSPDGSQLIVGDYNKVLHSLDPKTGTEKWNFSTAGGRWVATVLATSDTIYAPNADDKLYALDYTGKVKWTFTAQNALWSQPVTDGKVIYLGSTDHYIYALQPADGKQIWKVDLGSSLLATPLLSADGVLYAGTLGDQMLAVNAKDGTILWKTTVDGSIWGTPALNNGILYIGDLTGTFYSIAAKDGSIQNKYNAQSAIIDGPVVTDSAVIFGTEGGNLYAFDFNHTALWSKTFTDDKLYTSPFISSGKIYVAFTTSTDNLLMGFDAKGNQVLVFKPSK